VHRRGHIVYYVVEFKTIILNISSNRRDSRARCLKGLVAPLHFLILPSYLRMMKWLQFWNNFRLTFGSRCGHSSSILVYVVDTNRIYNVGEITLDWQKATPNSQRFLLSVIVVIVTRLSRPERGVGGIYVSDECVQTRPLFQPQSHTISGQFYLAVFRTEVLVEFAKSTQRMPDVTLM